MPAGVSITLRDLAHLLGGPLTGDSSKEVRGIAPIDRAVQGEVTFLANKKYERHVESTLASCLILDEVTPVQRGDLALIRLKNPYYGFLLALRHFHPQAPVTPGIHPAASIDPSARISEDARIEEGAVVGAEVTIGARSVISSGCVITSRVTIGDDCLIHPNVSILAGTRIGNRVIVHPGSTIGSDGFGFVPIENRYEKIPQIGSVLIEDDVEIGANCTVDRATLGETIIRRGVKLDNLIQIAHNVEIGEDTVIAAQSGISGSTTIGKHVLIGGQVGIVGHIDIGDDVTVGAQAGVSKSLGDRGRIFRGSPAREIHEELKQEAAIRRLPDLIADMRTLERRIRELEEELRRLGQNAPA